MSQRPDIAQFYTTTEVALFALRPHDNVPSLLLTEEQDGLALPQAVLEKVTGKKLNQFALEALSAVVQNPADLQPKPWQTQVFTDGDEAVIGYAGVVRQSDVQWERVVPVGLNELAVGSLALGNLQRKTIQVGVESLQERIDWRIRHRELLPTLAGLLPETFTMQELHDVITTMEGRREDIRNFSRTAIQLGLVRAIEQAHKQTGGRPAILWRLPRAAKD